MNEGKIPEWLPIAGFALGALALVALLSLTLDEPSGSKATTPESTGGTQAASPDGRPKVLDTVALEALEVVPHPAIVVNVYDPPKLRDALKGSAWTNSTLQTPLGRGFVGGWAGFFGTKGEDLDSGFEGTVRDLAMDKLLARPFQLVWFSGKTARSTPALVIENPDSTVNGAFEALELAAKRGDFDAGGCPGTAAAEKISISRWVIADQSVYAGTTHERMAFGRVPGAVQLALCAPLPKMIAKPGIDAEIAFETQALGRESQALTSLLGLDATPRAAFGVDAGAIVARGLSSEKADPRRLDTAALSDDILKAIPAEMPVVVTMQVKLPETLTRESFKAHLGETGDAKLETRQVALVWNPRGDSGLETEVALVWSKTADQKFLEDAFSGSNDLQSGTVCKQLVFASSQKLLDRLESACAGKIPNAKSAAPAVLASLRAPTSVGVNVDLGRLLSQITVDAWNAEDDGERDGDDARSAGSGPKTMPAEMIEAKKQLEALPFMALRGVVKDGTLVPGGLGS